MVIQQNMSLQAIIDVWPETKYIFQVYHLPLSKELLENLVANELLTELLKALNECVGSTVKTCTEGG